MNGDGRADVVCVSSTGGMMVWESKHIENFYEPDNPWTDEYFGFCNVNEKLVSANAFMLYKS